MLRTRLLTATAAVALFAAGSAFAQTAPIPTPSGAAQTTTGQTVMAPAAPDSTPPAAPAAPAAPTQTAAAAQNSVVDVLRANGQFTTLLAALDAAQLTETLSTQPAISIFAPTDAAFAALPDAERTRLLDPANVNELRQLLLYHVVVADVNSSQIEGAKGGVQTAATTEVQLDGTGDAIKVDNATVTTADIDAGNGAVFVIDRVLNPAQSLVASGDAEEAVTAPAAEDTATTATPPADEVTPPADSATADSMDADSATDEGAVAPPPTTPAAPVATAPTAPAPAAPATTPPVASPTTASPNAVTTTTRPATGVNAPNGQPAATTTTVASPTVPNPTDGQVDDADDTDDDDAAPAPTPTPQS